MTTISENKKKEEKNVNCNHKLKHLRQKSNHEGACYHIGSCLIDIFYCEKCGQIIEPQTKKLYSTESTSI